MIFLVDTDLNQRKQVIDKILREKGCLFLLKQSGKGRLFSLPTIMKRKVHLMTEKSKKTQTIPLENETVKISMKLIDPFPNHPFYVFDDEEMYDLTESIRKYGLITPVIVRRKQERFELISGHRRVHACRNLGHSEIACHVIEASDDEAIIMMVDSNCQRTKVLPSERAFAYKMKLEAMKRQGKRTDLTSAQVAQKSARKTSRQILADQEGQSQDQIRRYIRLTNLVPELLEFVDLEKIRLCPAVELSYLDEEAQRDVVDQIDETDAFPSHAQTIRMRKAFELGKLSYEVVKEIMNEEKPNQKPKYKFSYERLSTYIPEDLHNSQVEEFVIEALKYYTSRRRKGKQSNSSGKGCTATS